MKKTILLLALCFLAMGTANASIIPVLIGGPVADGPNFDYVYQIDLSGDESLDPAATNGATCLNLPCNPPGTFFTIYDVSGFVSALAVSPGWSASIQFTGLTPSGIVVPDSNALPNVTFIYTGPVVIGPVDILGFRIVSSDNGLATGIFSSQATNLSNGLTDQVVGSVSVPGGGASNPTPEPVSLVLLGSGLLGIGSVARKKLRP